MLRLVGTRDEPASDKVIPCRSYLADIAGNPGGGVSHGREVQSRHPFPALKGKRRRQTDLISVEMLWSHVRIVDRHSEKRSVRENILGFAPLDDRLERGQELVPIERIGDPDVGDLSFGQIDQSHGKSSSFFLRAHGENVFLSGVDFFADLALFDLARFPKLTWRSPVA